MKGLVYQGDRTRSTEAPSHLGVPGVRIGEEVVACGFTTRVLQTFLDTQLGNEAELHR